MNQNSEWHGRPASGPVTLTLPEAFRRAVTLHQSGKLADAERIYQCILGANPGHFGALHLLGVVAAQGGRYEDARELLRRALSINPRSAEAYSNQANVLNALRQFDEALASAEHGLALKSDFADALHNRGVALKGLERHAEALASFDRALALKPDFAEALCNRGVALQELRRHAEALASFDCVLALRPDFAEALCNRGVALTKFQRYAEAIASCDRALALKPDFAEALQNRGVALAFIGRDEAASKDFARALSLDPDLPYVKGALLRSRLSCCDWQEHETQARQLVADVHVGKRSAEPFSFLGSSTSVADQLRCARIWVDHRSPPAPTPLWQGTRYRHDRIRVAYISSDFRQHPLSFLTAGLFERHDRARFETIAVSLGPDTPTPIRSRVQAAFERFIDVRPNTDREVARMLVEWEVDIAVDLNGFTANARTGIFGSRPAPVQVSYLGYPATMGAPYIDYIVADDEVIPPEHRPCYTEKIVYLPDTYQVSDCNRRIAERTPTRVEVGLPEQGFVFCCFNNNYKITPDMFDCWMRLLTKVGGSVLWLFEGNAAASHNLRREAVVRGVAPERLVFARRIPLEEHLARQRRADLFLDTLPYNAHTTANDALWAGLPVLTCRGTTFAGRVAASLLRAIGLPELITESLPAYEALALRLATDPAMLAGIRDRLARHRDRYPLFDTDRFRRHLEAAYVAMWERCQRGEPPASFAVAPLP